MSTTRQRNPIPANSHRRHWNIQAARVLMGHDSVNVMGPGFTSNCLAAVEPVAPLVVEDDRVVACRCHAGDVAADDGDVMPPGEPCDRVVFEAMDPRCSQVGRQAELVRGPDAPADAFARLEDGDVVPVDGDQTSCSIFRLMATYAQGSPAASPIATCGESSAACSAPPGPSAT